MCDHLFALLSGLQLGAGLISGLVLLRVRDDGTRLTPDDSLMEKFDGGWRVTQVR